MRAADDLRRDQIHLLFPLHLYTSRRRAAAHKSRLQVHPRSDIVVVITMLLLLLSLLQPKSVSISLGYLDSRDGRGAHCVHHVGVFERLTAALLLPPPSPRRTV